MDSKLDYRIRNIISLCSYSEIEEITDSVTFDELNIDSLDLLYLVIRLEEIFSISIPDKDIENMFNVGDLMEYLNTRQNNIK